MGENGGEVWKRWELDVGTNKGVESCGRSNVNASQDCYQTATDQGGIEGVVHFAVNAANKSGERSRVVSSKSPKRSASSYVATDAGNEGWEKGDNQQTESTASGSSSLTINLCQWETKDASQDIVQRLDGIEQGDHV